VRISAAILALLLVSSALWAASVADYGAISDDDTDDTAAFAQAFAAEVKDLYVPPGTYIVGELALPDNTYVHGGGTATVLQLAEGAAYVLQMGNHTSVARLRVDGADAATDSWLNGLIRLPSVKEVSLTNLVIENYQGSAISTDHAEYVTIRDCRMQNLACAVMIVFSQRIRVLNNTVLDCSRHGIQFWGNWHFERKECSDLLIQGNYCRDAGGGPIWGTGAVRVVANDNIVVNAEDVGIDYEWCDDSVICGNTVIGAVNAGISLFYACKNIAITGNTVVIRDLAQGKQTGIWLTGTNRKEFEEDYGHRNVTIVGNTIRGEGPHKAGIAIGAESRDIVIAHNTLKNADIVDNSERPPSAQTLDLLKQVTVVPAPTEWRFATDPDDQGIGQQWFAEQFDDSQWATVRAADGLGYESQGFEDYTGYCWYRAELDAPQTADKQHVYLYFSTVDEQAWVYVNGEVAFEHTTQSTGMGVDAIWDLPFAEQVNELLRVGQSNLIAVRVHNKVGRGGITRPVYLLASDEALSLDQMTSLVKAFRARAEDAAAP